MSCTFTDEGRSWVLMDPTLLPQADADLWNEHTRLFMDHRGRVQTCAHLQPDMTAYAGDLRTFYVRDDESGAYWSAPYDPVQAELASFTFRATPEALYWTVRRDGIEVSLQVFVPLEERCEVWTATVRNVGEKSRQISFYPLFRIGMLGLLDHRGCWEPEFQAHVHRFFPYYVQIPDYYKMLEKSRITYCAVDREPVATEGCEDVFGGMGGLARPEALGQPKLGDGAGVYRPSVAAFQYSWELAPGAEESVNLVLGPAWTDEDIVRVRSTFLEPGKEEAALEAVRKVRATETAIRITTPDTEFDAFVNVWLPNRVHQMGETLRYNLAPQGRNAIQDAMGASLVAPGFARKWFTRIWAHQHKGGFLPHGMPFAVGVAIMPITQIPHRDTNVWGPPALAFYCKETADTGILDEPIPFVDDEEAVPLAEHLTRGLDYLLEDRTARGLSRIGQGDWNDPLNMAGPQDKGESVWLTMALAYACDQWADVLRQTGREGADRFAAAADECRETVNTLAWDGRWYRRGTTDAGHWFGSSENDEGRIFLNAQSWALISGCADEERTENLVTSVGELLETPSGPMVLTPAFRRMHEDIGKICLKTPGTGENGSVYCHAATFWAYGLLEVGRAEEAWSVLRRLLPGGDGPALTVAGQPPLYLPNFYRGDQFAEVAGRSSHSPTTGTAPWYYRTVVEKLFGLAPDWNGLAIQPNLPLAWDKVEAERRFRGAKVRVTYEKSGDTKEREIWYEGRLLESGILAVESGKAYEVTVQLPL